MASSTYLQLTNRVLNALNEVELDSTTFGITIGFATEVKNAVNQGLFDVYAHENVEWPFLFSRITFNTTRGIFNYTQDPTVVMGSVDWNSFKIKRPVVAVSSITQVAGTATVTTSVSHNFTTGDAVFIDGAVQTGYNTNGVVITVTGATTFTYLVSSTTVSPATGTIILKSNTVYARPLKFDDINDYRNNYLQGFGNAENAVASDYRTPVFIAADKNEDFIIFPVPDRVYTIEYECFAMPTKMVLYNDTHLIPEQWEQSIVDQALYRAYMFRDNVEEAKEAENKAQNLIRQMRKALMPVQQNAHWS